MFSKSSVIINVSQFKKTNEYLAYKSKDGLYNKKLTLNGKVINDDGTTCFQILKDRLVYSNWENVTINYQIKTRQKQKLVFDQVSEYLINDKLLFRMGDKYFIEDRTDSYNNIPAYLFQGIFYSKNNNFFNFENSKIQAFSLPSGEPLWQFDVEKELGVDTKPDGTVEQYEITRFIGVWNNQLIVLLNFGTFISLDIATGHLNWVKDSFDKNKTNQELENYRFIWPRSPLLDMEEEKIYILQDHHFISWDLPTNKADYLYDSRSLPKEEQFTFDQSRYIGNNLIYFIATKVGEEGSWMNYIGLFDIKKLEVVWSWSLPKGNKFSINQDNIQASEEQLYALDQAGNLYIFEKTED